MKKRHRQRAGLLNLGSPAHPQRLPLASVSLVAAAAWMPLVLGLLLMLSAPALAAVAGPGSVPLQCRIAGTSWQPCRMDVDEVGVRWRLVIGRQRLEFRHDGRGGVTMQSGDGAWRAVSSRWQPEGELCWDGVCARGDLPLD